MAKINMNNTKLDGKSSNSQEELLELLRKKFPEVFTEGRIDSQKLKQTLGDTVDLGDERYGMTWAGKSNCFRAIQTATTATLKPLRNESVDFAETENIFIEGDNLEVLKVLQRSYYGKVKMIYIDPPYNTGNDFIYNDKFKQDRGEYLQEAGIKNGNGDLRHDGLMRNTKDRGHYHSDWLNMMHPRLFLARNLLRQDGVIFVSIDDNEVHNLRMMMNGIFGEENFRNVFSVKRYNKNVNRQFIENGLMTYNTGFEYVVAYAKSLEFKFNPVYKEAKESRKNHGYWKGFWNNADRPTMRYDILGFHPDAGQWKWSKKRAEQAIKNYIKYIEDYAPSSTLEEYWEKTGETLEFIRRKTGKGKNMGVEHWIPPLSGILRNTGWLDIFASKPIEDMKGLFDFPKNLNLIKILINTCKDNGDLILDFFAGSGTTAHAVMALNAEDGGNRKCISVQLPELCDEKSEASQAGYKTIADIAKERIKRAGKKMKSEQENLNTGKLDAGFKVFKLEQSNFKIWRTEIKTADELHKQMSLFVDSLKTESEQDDILYELILKNGLELNVTVREKLADKKIYYLLGDGKLIIFLESGISQGVVNAILADKPQKVICLDQAFGGNDQLKTNIHLQMESAKVDFRVV